MKYTIQWVKEKPIPKLNTSVLECTGTDPNNNVVEFNIWMKDKTGQEFPNFKEIQAGSVVEGNMWQNPKDGKYSLYALKDSTKAKFTRPTVTPTRSQEIEKAQERKSESIAYFNSVNSAIAIVSEMMKEMPSQRDIPLELEAWRKGVIEWRDWFLSEYDKWNNEPF